MRKLTTLFVLMCCITFVNAQLIGDFETGATFSGYNNIRIPGDGGTKFNANETLESQGKLYVRLRGGARFKDKHNIFALYAPLKLYYEGEFSESIDFNGTTFAPNIASELIYQFNSYRITYRYDFLHSEKLRLGVGVTAKIRDAYIMIEQDGGPSSKKSNVGFVPILNVYAHWHFSEYVGLLFEGDGLASGQGRAFDFQLSVPIYITPEVYGRIGYRVLEGGADNEEVYNFTMVNYLNFGIGYNF